MNTQAPVKTFDIQIPASFAADQLSPDQPVAFNFTGRAGQLLRVKVAQSYRVQIQPPGGSDGAVGGDSTGDWLYGLPKTGTYRVLYAPWQETPGIGFDFVPENDPIANLGVTPEDVSVDFGAFAKREELAIAPFYMNETDDYWESRPTHLAVAHRDFEFRIMTVAGNKAIFKKNERMTKLAAALQTHGKNAQVSPYPVYVGGGLNFTTSPRYFEGEGWKGLRWIATYGQDIGCWFTDSAYIFEGISNDGRFYLLMRAGVSNPELEAKLVQNCHEPRDMSNPEVEKTFVNAASAMLDKAVSAADPASFKPSLTELDVVVRSLKLEKKP